MTTKSKHEFYERHNMITLNDYIEQPECKLTIPKALLGNKLNLLDIAGREIEVGDLVATGRSKYSDVKMGVIVGFTKSSARIAYFDDYEGRLGSPTVLASSIFVVSKKEIISE